MPFDWIEEAVVCTHSVSIRHRRLPAEQVLWLVIALALYRHKSIGEVLDDVGLALPDSQAPFVSKSAAAQARQRLGPEPVHWLFERSARAWCEQDRQAYLFKGLQLFAMDGTTLRTHDTVENREHFGAQNYVGETVTSYPQVRGVTLTALPGWRQLSWPVTRSYGKLPSSMQHLRERLVSLLNEERPGRKFDRAVKGRPRKYDVRVLKKNP